MRPDYRRALLSLAFCLTCFSWAFSQTAPNFTITTTDGVTRKLYEDYLNQGKTVLVKFFFTSCPFCIQMSPKVQKLYEKWGSGANGVEFISLATIQPNTNDKVKTYKTAYGEKFLGAGSDGGSITAAQPYMSNQFGTFYGTPSFFVVGPDKKVIWDPRGSSNDATIDSLDAAIARTRPSVPDVTGKVTNACGNPRPNLKLELRMQGVDTLETTTDSLGKYSFNKLPAGTSTSAEKFSVALPIDYSKNKVTCVTTADLIVINKHILAIEQFPNDLLKNIADSNNDNKVSTADMVDIRKVILKINDNFAGGKALLIFTDSSNVVKADSVIKIGKNTTGPYNNLNFTVNFKADVNCSCEIELTDDPADKAPQQGIEVQKAVNNSRKD